MEFERLRIGDPESMPELVRAYSPLVLKVARTFAADQDHADDLFQEIWRHIFSVLNSYEGRASVGGWIRTVATNLCISECRAQKARRAAHEEKGRELTVEMDGGRDSPAEELERKELDRALHVALSRLAPREHEAVSLRIMEERPPEEVARIMGIKKSSVRSTLRNALERLRRIMEEMNDEMSGHQPIP
jgi:RNA polymerase sigma-70 factor (ECF subfamily)